MMQSISARLFQSKRCIITCIQEEDSCAVPSRVATLQFLACPSRFSQRKNKGIEFQIRRQMENVLFLPTGERRSSASGRSSAWLGEEWRSDGKCVERVGIEGAVHHRCPELIRFFELAIRQRQPRLPSCRG